MQGKFIVIILDCGPKFYAIPMLVRSQGHVKLNLGGDLRRGAPSKGLRDAPIRNPRGKPSQHEDMSEETYLSTLVEFVGVQVPF